MVFDKYGLSDKPYCPVCQSKTLSLHKSSTAIGDYTCWEHESTMKLLGLDRVDSQMRFCPRCFHLFHFPLFDESRIYGEEGAECRKEYYENKYLPGKSSIEQGNYSKEWISRNREIFLYFNHIFEQIIKKFPRIKAKNSLKILDWGGGDGYLVETVSLISKKVLNVPCHAYCFDYHEWAAESNSPYFKYATMEGLQKEAPFDIIFVCHVLEHVAFPTALLKECIKHLASDGVIVAYVPFQQYRALSPRSSLWDYHQQLFSVNSMAEALRQSNFKNITSRLCYLSYRGNRSYHVLATGSPNGRLSKRNQLHYLADIYNFGKVLMHTIGRKTLEHFNNSPK